MSTLTLASSKKTFRMALLAVLTGYLSLNTLAATGKTPEPRGMFSENKRAAHKVLPRQALAGKSRAVKIHHDQLRRGRFFVSLPGNVSFEAVRDMQQEHGKGRFSWRGHASEDRENTVVFGVSGDAVAGTFKYRGKLFKLEPRANGEHVVSEIKPTDPAPELDPIPVADVISTNPDTAYDSSAAADGNGHVLDVMVAYTPAVQALYGAQGVEALVLQSVAEANQAYADSGMTTRLNLVHSVLTNYTEANNMNTDLSRLRSTSDGYMDELHTLRDAYGADLVSLIENEPQYCGLAYRMATLSSGFASSAFSVVHHSCATGYYSFAHEIGHNMGAHHDTNNASGAIFPYAYGFQQASNAFRTVMAYNCPGGCTRIGHFSNSNVLYNGLPTGYSNYTENALAIDTTAATVANFRQSQTQSPPQSPGNLSGVAAGANAVQLAWSDQSSDETGFILERSEDGTNFAQFATLPANQTSYTESDLQPATTYSYRVGTWNNGGQSGFSNIATVTTDSLAEYLDQLAFFEATAAGIVSGTLVDTRSAGGADETITEIEGTPAIRGAHLEHHWILHVQSGESVTLYAEVDASGTGESFTFAYSKVGGPMADDPDSWIDMFSVSALNAGERQFTLPPSLSGTVHVSVRDNTRSQNDTAQDTVIVDHLSIRTEFKDGEGSAVFENGIPPGC